ncbi:hypothetical protein HDU96_005667 [Phlyctochytrium bullatum]|nr:hypothetical protein HDU96_005667 [Phlyctochytrium bullatum]
MRIVCTDCETKFAFCTNCGGGGTWRSGKWRPRQLFHPSKQNCTLSHTRVGSHHSFRYVVYRLPAPGSNHTADVVLEPWEFGAAAAGGAAGKQGTGKKGREGEQDAGLPYAGRVEQGRARGGSGSGPRLSFAQPHGDVPASPVLPATATPGFGVAASTAGTTALPRMQQLPENVSTPLDMLAWDLVAFATDSFFTAAATPLLMRNMVVPRGPGLPAEPMDPDAPRDGWDALVAWDAEVRAHVEGFVRGAPLPATRPALCIGGFNPWQVCGGPGVAAALPEPLARIVDGGSHEQPTTEDGTEVRRYVCLALAPSPPPSRRRGRSEVRPSPELERCGMVVAAFATAEWVGPTMTGVSAAVKDEQHDADPDEGLPWFARPAKAPTPGAAGRGSGSGGGGDLRVVHWHMLGRITQDDCGAVRNLFRSLASGVARDLDTRPPVNGRPGAGLLPELVWVPRRLPECVAGVVGLPHYVNQLLMQAGGGQAAVQRSTGTGGWRGSPVDATMPTPPDTPAIQPVRTPTATPIPAPPGVVQSTSATGGFALSPAAVHASAAPPTAASSTTTTAPPGPMRPVDPVLSRLGFVGCTEFARIWKPAPVTSAAASPHSKLQIAPYRPHAGGPPALAGLAGLAAVAAAAAEAPPALVYGRTVSASPPVQAALAQAAAAAGASATDVRLLMARFLRCLAAGMGRDAEGEVGGGEGGQMMAVPDVLVARWDALAGSGGTAM